MRLDATALDPRGQRETAMTIRTMLVGASGGSASDGAIGLACRLAARFGAHLEGYHVKADPTEVIMAASAGDVGMPTDGAWIDQMAEDADRLAATTKASLLARAGQHGLTEAAEPPHAGATVGWRDVAGRAPELIAARARFFDLVVLGRSDRVIDLPSTDVIEETLLRSGRPILLAPATVPAAMGQTVAIGWDGSVPSVRALAAARPMLLEAKRVVMITVGDKPEADTPAACDYLRWHGLGCESDIVPAVSGVGDGEQLLATARDVGADLLVMGAYGHSGWREMLFGGATRTVVESSLLPVLLTH
jgi:nucleotide-binding universal stress UspA family protein